MLVAPALSAALREARFGKAETAGGTGGAPGHRGDALDPAGLRQAEAVRETFPDPADLYVSPTRRCRATAEALGLGARAARTGPAPCAMGRWQGRTLDEVAAAEPESVAAWLADPAAAPHGGESLLALGARVGRWLDSLVTAPGRVVVVAEPDVVRAAAVHALGAPAESFWRIDVRPLTVTELSGRAGRWNLLGGRPLSP